MMKKLILASASPRRSEILKMAGFVFDVLKTDSDEITGGVSPDELVRINAEMKSEAAMKKAEEGSVILCADTVVELDGEILGKPSSPENAKEMLKSLSGRAHAVFTGYTVTDGKKRISGTEKTVVTMRELTEYEIDAYVASGLPLDKAGAYGIQGPAGMFVSSITGDYYTVMGLPLCRISEILRDDFGIVPTEI